MMGNTQIKVTKSDDRVDGLEREGRTPCEVVVDDFGCGGRDHRRGRADRAGIDRYKNREGLRFSDLVEQTSIYGKLWKSFF